MDAHCASGTVSGQGCSRSAENAPQAALLVQTSHDVEDAAVLLLAGPTPTLALDLQNDLGTLDGRGDERGRDGGEEARSGDFGRGELLRTRPRHFCCCYCCCLPSLVCRQSRYELLGCVKGLVEV